MLTEFSVLGSYCFRGQAGHLHVVKTERRPRRFSNFMNFTSPTYLSQFTHRPVGIRSRFSEMLMRNNQDTERCFNTSHISQGRHPCRSGLCLNLWGDSSHISDMWFFWNSQLGKRMFVTQLSEVLNTSSLSVMFIHWRTLNRVFKAYLSSCSK